MAENPLKLEIEAVINDGQMEQSMSKIKNKLKEISSFTQGSSTPLSPQAEQMKNQQSKIMQDMQKRYTEDLLNRHSQIDKVVGNTEKLYQNQMLSKKAQVELQEKMLRLLKEQKQIEDSLGMKTTATAGQPQAEAAKPSPMANIKNLLSGAGVAEIVRQGIRGIETSIAAPARETKAQTSAITGASKPLEEIYRGEGWVGQLYAKERSQAMDIATTQRNKTEALDTAKAVIPMIAGAIGAVAGLGAGGVGAIAGGVGAYTAASALMGGGGGLTSDRGLAKLGGMLGTSDRYQKMLSAETMGTFNEQEQLLRAQNIPQELARGTLSKKGGNLLALQRATGMEDDELMSAMRSNMTYGGEKYTSDEIFSNIEAMRSAGATSESLRGDLAGRAASLQKQGIRNAGAITGRLAAQGEGVQTDEALTKVLSKAVKTGVDESELAKMPEEFNRFATMASEIATSGIGFSESLMDKFSAAITDMTSVKSMQGAKSFIEQFQERAGAITGIEGQIGYGFLQSSEAAGIVGEEGAAKLGKYATLLNKTTLADLEKDPTLLKGLAAQTGIPEEQIRELIETQEEKKQFKTGKKQEAFKTLESAGEKFREDQQRLMEQEEKLKQEMGDLYQPSEDVQKQLTQKFEDTEEYAALQLEARNAALKETGTEYNVTGAKELAEIQMLSKLTQPGKKKPGIPTLSEGMGLTTDMGALIGGLGTSAMFPGEKGETKAMESIRESRATGDIAQLDNLSKYMEKFGNAAKNLDANTALAEEAIATFAKMIDKDAKGAFEAFARSIKEMTTTVEEKNKAEAEAAASPFKHLMSVQPGATY